MLPATVARTTPRVFPAFLLGILLFTASPAYALDPPKVAAPAAAPTSSVTLGRLYYKSSTKEDDAGNVVRERSWGVAPKVDKATNAEKGVSFEFKKVTTTPVRRVPDAKEPAQRELGQLALVPRSDGSTTVAQVIEYLPGGHVRMGWEEHGKLFYKVVAASSLRDLPPRPAAKGPLGGILRLARADKPASAKPVAAVTAGVSGGGDGAFSVDSPRAAGAVFSRAKDPSLGNQDGILVSAEGLPFIAVADEAGGGGKIGGHAGGSSKIALDELHATVSKIDPENATPEMVKERLEAALLRAHERILATGAKAYTTFSAGVRVGNKLVVAQVGDSTLAVVRDGKPRFVTKEDGPARDRFAQARTAADQGEALEVANIIRSALGHKFEVQSSVSIIDCKPGDRVVVYSDGIGDARLLQGEQIAQRGKFQQQWPGDVVLDDVVHAMTKPFGGFTTPQASSAAVEAMLAGHKERGWAKIDDVAFGVLDLK